MGVIDSTNGTISWYPYLAIEDKYTNFFTLALDAALRTLADICVVFFTIRFGLNTDSPSYAVQALSASFAPSTPAFPFTGNAQINGLGMKILAAKIAREG